MVRIVELVVAGLALWLLLGVVVALVLGPILREAGRADERWMR